ncbi:MAG: PAS domain-containing protein, partial [Devosiaceae bacterium]|nr:PAS domain-containing protein [Devosiaceae bacterium]
PTKIRKSLANVFILESDENEDEFLFRLAGSHLCTTYCRELKGRSFNELWHHKDREALKTLIRAVTEDHAVALTSFNGISASGKRVSFENILLPVRHNGDTTSRILGAMSAIENPYWLGLDPIVEQRITGLRLIWPDDVSNQLPLRDLSSNIINNEVDVYFKNEISNKKNEQTIVIPTKIAIPTKIHGNFARRYSHLSVIDGGKS